MKRGFALFLAVCLLIIISPKISIVSAYSQELELQQLEEIDIIFQEINQIALEKAHAAYLETLGFADNSEKMALITANQLKIEKRETELDLLLADLNVHKIDPDNENDMVLLSTLSETFENYNLAEPFSNPTDTAPDLSFLANVFTVYIYDGTHSYNGENHTYREIRVVDNKGYKKFTVNEEYDAVDKNLPATLVPQVLNFAFGIVFSEFLGKTPQGVITNYTLDAIFTVLEGIENASNTIAVGSESLYRVACTSVTEMHYYYYYNEPVWKLIGVSANIKFLETESFQGNVAGEPKHDERESYWTTKSGDYAPSIK